MSRIPPSSYSSTKDFYKILQVSRTATALEIKEAYRRLAMELHPDRNDGCEVKADHFKSASEAYSTLSDDRQRRIYDNELDSLAHARHYQYGHVHYKKHTVRQDMADYRKVYTTRPPPGFKTFDKERHFRMHYGNGEMMEEIERARMRARRAGTHNATYESPLGSGFTYNNPHNRETSDGDGGRWVRYGQKVMKDGNFQQTAYFEEESSVNAKEILKAKETIKQRMKERRDERIRQQLEREKKGLGEKKQNSKLYRTFAEQRLQNNADDSCSIM